MDTQKMSYSEMVEYAKTIHPLAKPQLTETGWQIVISTGIEDSDEVSASWEGTPAAVRYRMKDAGWGNLLAEWGGIHNYKNMPLEILAGLYNLDREWIKTQEELANVKLAAEGLGSQRELVENRQSLKKSDFETLIRVQTEVLNEIYEEFQTRRKQLLADAGVINS